MLLAFKVKNFKSFGNELQTFSLVAGKQSKHKNHVIETNGVRFLKFAAMYGANASGKTNFIRAINFAKNSIQIENIVTRHTNESNKFLLAQEDSYFEFEVLIDNNYFSYGFEINFDQRKIVSEWLIDFTINSKPKKIFERINNKIETNIKFNNYKEIKKMFEVYITEYEQNTTDFFLRYISQKTALNSSQINEIRNIFRVYNELVRNIFVAFPDQNVQNFELFIILKKNEFQKMLAEFSTGISEIKFNHIGQKEFLLKIPPIPQIQQDVHEKIQNIISASERIQDEDIRQQNTAIYSINNQLFFFNYDEKEEGKIKYSEVTFLHQGVSFDYGDESDGTKRLIQLLSILIDNTPGKVFFVDEIDRSLHPLITQTFIELFFKQKAALNQQLIITTHESRLLNFNLIRQDEIWFAEKDKSSYTCLFSLEDFSERNDRKLESAYLDGRYGGIPILAEDFLRKYENES